MRKTRRPSVNLRQCASTPNPAIRAEGNNPECTSQPNSLAFLSVAWMKGGVSDAAKVTAHCRELHVEAAPISMKANTLISPKNMAHRFLRPTRVRLGLRPIGWHVLRHTHATWLSESGATIRAAQDILGQSDVETTLRVYTHSVLDSKRRAVANVAALLFPSVPPQGQVEEMQRELVS